MKKRNSLNTKNKKKKGSLNLKGLTNILNVNKEGLSLFALIRSEIVYQYILQQVALLRKTETEIIKELAAIEIKKFHNAYRKWKERLKHKRKNKLNKNSICKRKIEA